MIKYYWIMKRNHVGAVISGGYEKFKVRIRDLQFFVERMVGEGSFTTPMGRIVYSRLGDLTVMFLVDDDLFLVNKLLAYLKRRFVGRDSRFVLKELKNLFDTLFYFHYVDPIGFLRTIINISSLSEHVASIQELPIKYVLPPLDKEINYALSKGHNPKYYLARGRLDYAFFSALNEVMDHRVLVLSTLGILALRIINNVDIPREYIIPNLSLLRDSHPELYEFLNLKFTRYITNIKTLQLYNKVVDKYLDYLRNSPLMLIVLVDDHLIYNPKLASFLQREFKDYPFIRTLIELAQAYSDVINFIYSGQTRELVDMFIEKKKAIMNAIDRLPKISKETILDENFDPTLAFEFIRDSVVYLWLLDNLIYFNYLNSSHEVFIENEKATFISLITKLYEILQSVPTPLVHVFLILQFIFSILKKILFFMRFDDHKNIILSYVKLLENILTTKILAKEYYDKLIVVLANALYVDKIIGGKILNTKLIDIYFWTINKLLKHHDIFSQDKISSDIEYMYLLELSASIASSLIIYLREKECPSNKLIDVLVDFIINSTRHLLTHGIVYLKPLVELKILLENMNFDVKKEKKELLNRLYNELIAISNA